MAKAVRRTCHVVLEDVHGGLVDLDVKPWHHASRVGREHWARCARDTLLEAGASIEQLRKDRMRSLEFWRMRMFLELNVPKDRLTPQGRRRVIVEYRFHEIVNEILLEWVASKFMSGLSTKRKRELARTLKRKRRNDQGKHALVKAKRDLIWWMVGVAHFQLFHVTAQSRRRAQRLLDKCDVPPGPFERLFTSIDIGFPKSHPTFWRRAQERTGYELEHTIAIEDSISMANAALMAGIGVILWDPDGNVRKFIKEVCNGSLGGAPLIRANGVIPPNGPFVVCARTVGMAKRILQRMCPKVKK